LSGDLLERLGDACVLVVGDLMLDEYVWGDVRRISPEAPVPVVEIRGRTHVPGGAGNTAAGVAALGGQARLAGVVGEDDDGRRLLDVLAAGGIDCDGVLTLPGRVTTTKTRVIAHSQQVVRADSEERAPLPKDAEDAVLDWAGAQLEAAGAVVLSDYAKGTVSGDVAAGIIGLARERGRPVVVDPKGHDYGKYRGATVLTPNVHEVERAAHHPVETYDEVVTAARRLSASLDGSVLLVTRGADGMLLVSGRELVEIAAEAQDVYDVTGAGDTVVAVLATALAAGAEMEAAVRLANTAAGIAVSKVGTAAVTLAELRGRSA
jgi:D-beta-D-heptose 7-phosphate kinase/D-beta-D-heptose 1-phosphate adenosyltransferase